MNDNYLKSHRTIAYVIKTALNLREDQVILPIQNPIIKNNHDLQIIIENRGSEDVSNYSEKIITDEGMDELINKHQLERIAVNIMAYTINEGDNAGYNAALDTFPKITAIFNTMQAKEYFASKGIFVNLIGRPQDVSTVEGEEGLARILIELQVRSVYQYLNKNIQYWDDFSNLTSLGNTYIQK